MTNSVTERIEKLINLVGIVSICLFSYLYSIFGANFAERHISNPNLSFPIFVGEILLFFCMILLAAKIFILRQAGLFRWGRWHTLILIYILWVLYRALHGYINWGPLALRNAALFYYPWFAFLIFNFSKRLRLNDFIISLILVTLGLTFMFYLDERYFYLTYVILILILLSFIKVKPLKYCFSIVCAIVFCLKFQAFFIGSRSHLVALVSALLFLVLFIILLEKDKKKLIIKSAVLTLFFLLFVSAIWRFFDKNALRSLITPNEVINLYHEKKEEIKRKEAGFTFRNLQTKLYFNNLPVIESDEIQAGLKTSTVNESVKSLSKVEVTPPKEVVEFEKFTSHRNLETAYSNILFRLFIWEDMIKELLQEKAWLGINFGKAQRSKSIEILGWARTEWERDGWITPHNSLLHIVYRSGILGLLMIGFVAGLLYKMSCEFLDSNSLAGGFLITILVYWIVIANFLVIFELPYTAIPFWSIFGISIFYYYRLKEKKLSENTSYS